MTTLTRQLRRGPLLEDPAAVIASVDAELAARAVFAAAQPKFGCLMAMLPSLDAELPNRALALADGTLAGDGIETEPHCTVLYGFNAGFDAGRLRALLQSAAPVYVQLGPVGRFEGEEHDVVKFEVKSPGLRKLNAAIAAAFPDDITFTKWVSGDGYNPHVTVAYVQKGTNRGFDLPDMVGRTFKVTQLLYSLPDKQGRCVMELGGAPVAEGTAKAQDATPDPEHHHATARKAAKALYRAAVDDWLAKLSAALVAAVFGHAKADDYDGVWFPALLENKAQDYPPMVAEAARHAIASASGALVGHAGADGGFTGEEVERFAQERAALAGGLVEAAKAKALASLKRGLEGGEDARALARRIQEGLEQVKEGHGEAVADTEAQVAYGKAQQKALELAGYTHKRWETVGDDRVRDSHYLCESQGAVPVGAAFHNGLMYPGDPNGPPEEVINCRCRLRGVR